MILKYNFAKDYHPTKKKIKECDDGFRAMKSLIVEVAKYQKLSIILVWFLSRFYRKRITKDFIEYDLYLIRSDK